MYMLTEQITISNGLCYVLICSVCTQVRSQNEQLQAQLKEKETHEKVLQQEISKAEEKYLDLNVKYENLKIFSVTKEMEDQISSLQRKMVDVKSTFECIDVIKIKHTTEELKVINTYIKPGIKICSCQ